MNIDRNNYHPQSIMSKNLNNYAINLVNSSERQYHPQKNDSPASHRSLNFDNVSLNSNKSGSKLD